VATFCWSSLWSISLRAWAIYCGVNFGLQPNFTPRSYAAFTPARVRSLIRLRSSSASTPIICHMARPVGVSVSICSVRERNFDAPLPEVVEQVDQIAQAAAQAVKFPDSERVAVLQCLEATEQGRALGRGS
jgi:hypothetical protein